MTRRARSLAVAALALALLPGALDASTARAAPAARRAAGGGAAAVAAAPGQGAIVDRVEWEASEAGGRIVVVVRGEATYSTHAASADPGAGLPARAYVDLRPAQLGAKLSRSPIPVGDGILQRIRIGQFDRQTVRIVVDLAEPAVFDVRTIDRPARLLLTLRSRSEPVAAAKRPAAVAAASPAPMASPGVPPAAEASAAAASAASSRPPAQPPAAIAEAAPAAAPTPPADAVAVTVPPEPAHGVPAASGGSGGAGAPAAEVGRGAGSGASAANASATATAGEPAARTEGHRAGPAPEAATAAAADAATASPAAPGPAPVASPVAAAASGAASSAPIAVAAAPTPAVATAHAAPAFGPRGRAGGRSSRPRVVVLDPGHGGKDPGARGVTGDEEKTVTLAIAEVVAERLRPDYDLRVVLTRTDDRTVTLEQRTAVANAQAADLFVSIHANASENVALAGIETYTLNNTNDRATIRLAAMENGLTLAGAAPGEPDLAYILSDLLQTGKEDESVALAESIHGETVRTLRSRWKGVSSLGVKKGPFYVLVGAYMPCVLVEVGFLSHEVEGQRVASRKYQSDVAEGIARGIRRFLDSGPANANL